MNRHLLITLVIFLASCATHAPDDSDSTNNNPELLWPTSPEQPRIQFVASFSNPTDLEIKKGLLQRVFDLFAGSEEQGLSRPYAVSANKDTVVVADPDSSSVHVFNIRKKTYDRITEAGQYELESPIGVAHDSNRLYIADSKLNKVFILDYNHSLLHTLEGFKRPTGLALDEAQQRIYISDTLSHNVLVYSSDGQLQKTIGERGEKDLQFNYPSHLAFSRDSLVVNDTMNFRIQATDLKGDHLFTFGKQGDASGYLTQPKGVAVDSEGNIYVADALANRIQIFNQNGDFLLEFGKRGQAPGDFNMPSGLAIWNDKIYVADSYNQRIQVFQYLKVEK